MLACCGTLQLQAGDSATRYSPEVHASFEAYPLLAGHLEWIHCPDYRAAEIGDDVRFCTWRESEVGC